MPQPTPHSGYHWKGNQQPFFEGWYYRLTLPPDQGTQTIAFMYSLQDPAGQTPASGGAVQILGPDEQYFCRALPDIARFWALKHTLGHGHSRSSAEHYRVTATLHEGTFWDPSTNQTVSWHYTVAPFYSWGPPHQPQSTAGWLSQFQIFEPGWQILMAHGWATGWFKQLDASGNNICRFDFKQVPAYAEKNWGGAFPQKWFWIQCNAFDKEPDLTLTCGGGIRQVLGQQESVGLVGIHHQGRYYECGPWIGRVSWQVSPWGDWWVWAEQQDYAVEIIGQTAAPGIDIRVPTATGLEFLCRDTTQGEIRVNLWKKGVRSQLLLSAQSQQAGLEIGGKGWNTVWKHPG